MTQTPTDQSNAGQISTEQAVAGKTSADQTATEHAASEPVTHTAEIIAFPVRKPALPVASPAPAVSVEQQRLARALVSLNGALADQRTAVTAWRGALADLKTATSSLGDSLVRYRGSLQSLGQDVNALHEQAKVLGQWGEDAAPSQNVPPASSSN